MLMKRIMNDKKIIAFFSFILFAIWRIYLIIRFEGYYALLCAKALG